MTASPDQAIDGQRLARFAFVLIAAIYWLSIWLSPFAGNWIFKFTPMLIAAWVLFRVLEHPVATLMSIGFVTAAIGDIFLALDRGDYFIYGLSAFLVTQIAFASAFFACGRRFANRWLWWLPALLLGIGLFTLMRPQLDDLLIPVAVYIVALMVMVIAASRVEEKPGKLYAGALLFLVSDALIGIDRFLFSFENALLAIIACYFLAQYLIFTGALKSMPKAQR